MQHIEHMLQIDGLQYFSTTRPRGKRGGGAAIIVNKQKFNAQKLDIYIPHKLEIIWAILKPKSEAAKIKNIILCSFYSPPRSRLMNKLKDHIIGTLQMLTTKYPGCGIFVGGDKNKMNISSLLNNNLKLKQIVSKPTRKNEILDIILTNLYPYYNSPIILPPVQPDVAGQGVPSDHSVPLVVPHTDPSIPPQRHYRTIITRPLPDSKVRNFGQWITSEKWDCVNACEGDPSQQVYNFEKIVQQKLDEFLPQKIVKIGIEDKPFMTNELKKLKRLRMREYVRNGKSEKYIKLREEFKVKFKKESQLFLRKNVDSLKESDPGKAYNVLKRMGAMPGELEDSSTFTLPSFENLSPEQAAEKIADHFSKISREFPPLKEESLPKRVQRKLQQPENESKVPEILEYEVFDKIKATNKPKSGVPGDLPRRLVKEFGPELAVPTCRIFNSVIKSAKQGVAKWPASWKQEFGVPLKKSQDPQSEDDLRVISLTAFFSKVLEKFVVKWLMDYISDKIDPKQFGGLKGNSISHYMIELINFIQYNQDFNLPIGVLVCAIDFSKAFNRQNHNLLVTKLSDMGVPGWLLNIVMGFLSDRILKVNYKGATSKDKILSGGGPQGTILGLLLFLILINYCGFENVETKIGQTITKQKRKFVSSTLHTKYVDDLTLLESLNLQEVLIPNPQRPQPDNFHARLGLKLHPDKSQVYNQIEKVERYAKINEMRINSDKCKFMLFNPTENFDFIPEYQLGENCIQTEEKMKILGITLTNNLKWRSNTDSIVRNAFLRLWMIKRLKQAGASLEDMTDVYIKQIRSVLEFGVPVWNSGLTKEEVDDIERVQKSFLQIVLGSKYDNYENALGLASLESLQSRRYTLCRRFAIKAAKHPKHQHWFEKASPDVYNTRSNKCTYKQPICRLSRFQNGPIPYLTKLLNTM